MDMNEMCVVGQFPNVTRVETYCFRKIDMRFIEPFVFPAKLKVCHMKLAPTTATMFLIVADAVNGLLRSLARFAPDLRELNMSVSVDYTEAEAPRLQARLDFKPLLKLKRLCRLSMKFVNARNHEQWHPLVPLYDVLHAHPSIEWLSFGQFVNINSEALECLASKPPPNLKAIRLYSTQICKRKLLALQQIKTLTSIEPFFFQLESLQNLVDPHGPCTKLRLAVPGMPIARYINDSMTLKNVIDVALHHRNLTARDLKTFLVHMPQLRVLKLDSCRSLDSLHVFPPHCAITQLHILACPNLPFDDLVSLHASLHLTHLQVYDSFQPRPSASVLAALLPNLQRLETRSYDRDCFSETRDMSFF